MFVAGRLRCTGSAAEGLELLALLGRGHDLVPTPGWVEGLPRSFGGAMRLLQTLKPESHYRSIAFSAIHYWADVHRYLEVPVLLYIGQIS